jgi:hypothetical protein
MLHGVALQLVLMGCHGGEWGVGRVHRLQSHRCGLCNEETVSNHAV